MYGCESWTIKKAEHQRIDAFELRCWRRVLRVPWTARRSNQFILKEISFECSLEGIKLKLQNFGHLIWRADSLAKTLMVGKIEGKRRRGQQRLRWLDSITNSMDVSSSRVKMVKDSKAWHLLSMGSWTWLSNWTATEKQILSPHQKKKYIWFYFIFVSIWDNGCSLHLLW